MRNTGCNAKVKVNNKEENHWGYSSEVKPHTLSVVFTSKGCSLAYSCLYCIAPLANIILSQWSRCYQALLSLLTTMSPFNLQLLLNLVCLGLMLLTHLKRTNKQILEIS
ncbi:hypothetical protein QWZ13_02655 [Reinekea marina]|uniref:hypothetical protein n=1 Tax=Reinekea marina TaxID=1310421 RepID=UPI0025B52C73|nr:hypothetical protein [Reinekea marina]MDN3647810.1 hypothetical protein [Reinekea marina]